MSSSPAPSDRDAHVAAQTCPGPNGNGCNCDAEGKDPLCPWWPLHPEDVAAEHPAARPRGMPLPDDLVKRLAAGAGAWTQDQVENLLAENDDLRDALRRVLPLVVALSERGWIKGAEATEIIREALGDAE